MSFYDMHCHLDFADNRKDVAAQAKELGIIALSSTVVPSDYAASIEEFKPWPNIHVALGMHPWWIAENRVGEIDMIRFETLAQTTPYIGEIGLDFHGKRALTRKHQIKVLYRLLEALEGTGNPKLIFLHSVKATDDLLDMLEECGTLDANTCVFHWFQGTPDEFGRALARGCYFSVGMRMLATDKGREVAKAVPLEKLLIETDNPPHEGIAWSGDIWQHELQNTLHDLARLRNMSEHELQKTTAATSARLLDR